MEELNYHVDFGPFYVHLPQKQKRYLAVSSVIDRILAALALIVLSPLFLVVSVAQTFGSFRSTQSYSAAVTSTMSALQLSRPSVTSYLPYEKGVYFPEEAEAANISAGAERQRHYRAVAALKKNPCEENLWKCVVAFRGYKFKTMSGLPFTYTLKKGRGDEFTKELWIDRREDSKSLAWSSVMLAYHNIGKIGEVVDRPKALGDIRGVSYIYGLFYRFGLIDVPDKAKEKMAKQ